MDTDVRILIRGIAALTIQFIIACISVCQVLEGEDYQYDLFSVVIHGGGAHGGHYHAYIRDLDALGHWVTPVSHAALHLSLLSVFLSPIINLNNVLYFIIVICFWPQYIWTL